MNRNYLPLIFGFVLQVLFTLGAPLRAQTVGPFNPEDWPPTRDPNKKVHYVSTEMLFSPVSANWLDDELQILSVGEDQVTQPITIGGHTGLKVTAVYLNVADKSFMEWADDEVIDILMQVYGDAALLGTDGNPRNFNFLTGTLPELSAPNGGSIPVEAKNRKWNWVLFRIPNGIRPSDGTRYVGSIPANAQGGVQFGGVNGGTIRDQTVPGLIVRLVAFGEQGAFGEPEAINLFASAESCPPEPETNLVFVDVHARTSQQLEVLNNGDQTVVFGENIGPAEDRRRAVRPNGSFMNFGITNNFLGLPCNDPRAMKICVDFFDDPALAGTVFGPEAYATDDTGGTAIFPMERRHTVEGSGKWMKRAFVVPAVNLRGVNTSPLTGGPRLAFEGGQVFISRIELGIFRTGTNSLAGQDPLPNCFEDPNICTDAYGNFAELDLAKGIQNGLAPGNSGGDQEMIQAEAGPANDRRLAIRPAMDDGSPGFGHIYLNFAITDTALGPSSQPNARLAICVTYFDDPDLAGGTFRPEVYQSDRGGQTTLAFTSSSIAVNLEGTGAWREAYFEIPDMKFNGVNQGPQAAARFVLNRKIFFTRLRYAVIRPCGPMAGINLLESCKPAGPPGLAIRRNPDGKLRLAWPVKAEGFTLQETSDLTSPQWAPVTIGPLQEGDQFATTLTVLTNANRFFRLVK